MTKHTCNKCGSGDVTTFSHGGFVSRCMRLNLHIDLAKAESTARELSDKGTWVLCNVCGGLQYSVQTEDLIEFQGSQGKDASD